MEIAEGMAEFFDARAAGYDEHMRGNVFTEETFAQFYDALAAPIAPTNAPLNILDLGCGTGLEIEALLRVAPNAQIKGVDLSQAMLEHLRARYAAHLHQITLVVDSYVTMPFGAQVYDYIVSAMTVHHLLRAPKRQLYAKIYAALKPGGQYIEGDAVTLAEMESQFLAEYAAQIDGLPRAEDGHYHVDIPFSLDTQRALLLAAGFKDFELVWQKDRAAVWNAAVYTVTK